MSSTAPTPGQRYKVGRRTMAVFQTIFDGSDGRGSISWAEFKYAMIEVGFSVKPCRSGGSGHKFCPPRTVPGNKPFFYHEPHPIREIGKASIAQLASKLQKTYGWDKDTFQDA